MKLTSKELERKLTAVAFVAVTIGILIGYMLYPMVHGNGGHVDHASPPDAGHSAH